ncbi:MAG: hypothetical protein OXB95_14480 [Rhodobacteraceae bacterium]|nr:hypothetical protein [Paracoccaceae bacterium]
MKDEEARTIRRRGTVGDAQEPRGRSDGQDRAGLHGDIRGIRGIVAMDTPELQELVHAPRERLLPE